MKKRMKSIHSFSTKKNPLSLNIETFKKAKMQSNSKTINSNACGIIDGEKNIYE